MIIVITCKERNLKTGRDELVVSHGVDESTGRSVVLPCEHPQVLGAVWDASIGEFVLPDESAE